MLKTILDFFTGHKETDWSQEDKEACVKLLVLIMYIDDKLTDEEDQMIHRQIGLFDWKGVHNEDYFLSESIREIRDLNKNSLEVEDYVFKIASKISDSEVKEKIITTCSHLCEADGEIADSEKEVVEMIKKALA